MLPALLQVKVESHLPPQVMSTLSPPLSGKLIPAYTAHLLSHTPFVRMGYSLALGCFPRPLLRGKLREVLDPLLSSCQVTKGAEVKFAEARSNIVKAITRYSVTPPQKWFPESGSLPSSGSAVLCAP